MSQSRPAKRRRKTLVGVAVVIVWGENGTDYRLNSSSVLGCGLPKYCQGFAGWEAGGQSHEDVGLENEA